MIYAQNKDAAEYFGLYPRLDRVLGLLLKPDYLASVPTVRQELEGESLFVTRFDVETSTDPARLFEYHRRYLDVFTLAAGAERVDIARPEALELRDQKGDWWGCAGEAEQSVLLRPGSFLVLFPGDAHRPGMALSAPEKISRIVFKILI